MSFGGGGGARSQHLSRLSNHNVPPGSSENPYGEARSVEFDGTGGTGRTGWTGGTVWTGWTVNKKVLQFFSF